MSNLSSEVLIYIQTLKNYFNNNINVKDYFIVHNDEDLFYNQVSRISQLNFDSGGQPMLTIEQFETIRLMMLQILFQEKDLNKDKLYVDLKEFGKFYLN